MLNRLGKKAKAPIVEIGTHKGKSACCMVLDSDQVLYAIDLWDSGHQDEIESHKEKGWYEKAVYSDFLRQVKKAGLQSKIIPIKGSSFDVGHSWDKPIGLLHIDGNHTYEGCRKDFENFTPHIIRGGWVAFHDYRPEGNRDVGVREVIYEFVKDSPDWKLVCIVDKLYVAKKI